MDIQHIHLEQTSSTQSVLKEHLKSHHASGHILISTDRQDSGVGRRGHVWNHFPDALAFSFTLRPSATLTLTPLEIGLHIAKYFSPFALLKWPNDILNKKNEKAGGIICQLLGDTILVGVGINLKVPNDNQGDYPYPIGGIFSDNENIDTLTKKDLPLRIYQSILNSRIDDETIIKEWSNYCCHLNSKVTIQDGEIKHRGKFIGISSNGEAKISTDFNKEKTILTGSLRF